MGDSEAAVAALRVRVGGAEAGMEVRAVRARVLTCRHLCMRACRQPQGCGLCHSLTSLARRVHARLRATWLAGSLNAVMVPYHKLWYHAIKGYVKSLC